MSGLMRRLEAATAPHSGSHLTSGKRLGGIGGFMLDKAERYGASAVFGAAKGYYGERFMFKNLGYDLWIGAALTLAGGAANMMGNGHSALGEHLERIGDAGVSSYINSLAAGWGMKKAGREIMVLDGGKVSPALSGKQKVHGIGMIPPAVGDRYLSGDEISHYAARR